MGKNSKKNVKNQNKAKKGGEPPMPPINQQMSQSMSQPPMPQPPMPQPPLPQPPMPQPPMPQPPLPQPPITQPISQPMNQQSQKPQGFFSRMFGSFFKSNPNPVKGGKTKRKNKQKNKGSKSRKNK